MPARDQQLSQQPSVICGQIERNSIEDMEAALRNYYDLEVHQLKPGPYRGILNFVASDRALLYREEYPQATMISGELVGGRFGIALPLAGPTARFAGLETSHGRAASALGGEQMDFITPGGHSQLIMLVDHARLYEFAETSRVAPRSLRALAADRKDMPLKTNPRFAACVSQTFSKLLEQAAVGKFTATSANFEDLILGAILSVVDHLDEPHGRPPASVLFRRARDLAASMDYSPPIAVLAAHLRVSPRTLHHAFVSTTGLPPSDYLMRQRLNRARTSLVAADRENARVTAIATQLGFTELGRFASHYRRLFGETPVETLQRSSPLAVPVPHFR